MGGGRHLLPLDPKKKKKKKILRLAPLWGVRLGGGDASRAPPSGGAGTERRFHLFSAKRPKLLAQEYKQSQGLFIREKICFQSFLRCWGGKLSHSSKTTGRVFVGHSLNV